MVKHFDSFQSSSVSRLGYSRTGDPSLVKGDIIWRVISASVHASRFKASGSGACGGCVDLILFREI